MSLQNAFILVMLAFSMAGCESTDPDSCKVLCVADADCPDGQACGDLGRCTSGQACPCTAGEFLGCGDSDARFCSETADGVRSEPCEFGCNAEAARCNACVPETASCNSLDTMLERCGADGLVASTEECRLSCANADATAAHCQHIVPAFLPDICDDPASTPALTFESDVALDTSTDATCNGGIIAQAGGREICVIRHASITVNSIVTIRGGRLVALVADDALLVQGTIDVSADGTTDGPGGGSEVSGGKAVTSTGGGGAGFGADGAAGGGAESGGGAAGGAAVDPFTLGRFIGGPRPTLPSFQQVTYPLPGGGGGGLMLVSCKGTVSVSGSIDAGGGGGGGGRDSNLAGTQNYVGGAGGGAGGFVLMQGADVSVMPSGGLWANGGAGGGGCTGDNCIGTAGGDGTSATTGAVGGAPMGEGGTGGAGGSIDAAGVGLASFYSPGGGGGGVGRLQTCTPANGTLMKSGNFSPSIAPNRIISIR